MAPRRTAPVVGASSDIGAAAVRSVIGTPAHVCPVEIERQPQLSPVRRIDRAATG